MPVLIARSVSLIRASRGTLHGDPSGTFSHPDAKPNRSRHRRQPVHWTIQLEFIRDCYRWLGQESGLFAPVGPTGCVHQEGVTDEHVARRADCEHFATLRFWERDLGFLAFVCTRQAYISGGSQKPRHLEMRAGEQAARCVVHPRVGDQAQQEQRPPLRSVVHEPAGVTWRLEARIDVPPGVPRILVAGKSHHEGTQVRAVLPGIGVDQLANGVEQARGVGSLPEAISRRHTPDHWSSPRVRASKVGAQLLGGRETTLLSQFFRKSGTNHEVAVPDEAGQLRWLQPCLPEGGVHPGGTRAAYTPVPSSLNRA